MTLTTETRTRSGDDPAGPRGLRALPWLWLGLSAIWLGVIFATEVPAWTLAIWIAATGADIRLFRARLKPDPHATGNRR